MKFGYFRRNFGQVPKSISSAVERMVKRLEKDAKKAAKKAAKAEEKRQRDAAKKSQVRFNPILIRF